MLSKKRRAVSDKTTPTHNQLYELYLNPTLASTTKFRELAANLLIGLQTQTLTVRQCRHGWQFFEVLLRQYYEVKTSGGFENA